MREMIGGKTGLRAMQIVCRLIAPPLGQGIGSNELPPWERDRPVVSCVPPSTEYVVQSQANCRTADMCRLRCIDVTVRPPIRIREYYH